MAAAMVMTMIMAIMGALLVATVPYAGADDECNFSSSCGDIEYESGSLFASCTSRQGQQLPASIDLNRAVANIDGTLECPKTEGGFISSCSDIQLVNGHWLIATCKDKAGGPIFTYLNLDTCIENDDATLQWCGTFSTNANATATATATTT